MSAKPTEKQLLQLHKALECAYIPPAFLFTLQEQTWLNVYNALFQLYMGLRKNSVPGMPGVNASRMWQNVMKHFIQNSNVGKTKKA